MKTTKTAFPLMMFVVLLMAPSAVRADNITFNASGTFADSSVLSGTVTINTTTGVFTAISLSTTGGVSTGLYNSFFNPPGCFPSPAICGFVTQDGSTNQLALEIPTNSLIGYTGGPLCSLSDSCIAGVINGNSDLTYSSQTSTFLSAGTLTPVTSAPEPPTWHLLSIGALGLACMGTIRRKQLA